MDGVRSLAAKAEQKIKEYEGGLKRVRKNVSSANWNDECSLHAR